MIEILTSGYFYYILLMLAVFILFCIWIHTIYSAATEDSLKINEELHRLAKYENVTTKFQILNEWMINNSTSKYMTECIRPAWDNYYEKSLALQ